ncbi:GcrA family cell cycle regulator [Ponticaulis sp.]|uniref:GcrA family cell cycle regulator n=1 Tax=Ponticaulis sp. TaxID=2020902 RepID=UPI000B6C872B|nr:GcrA family cell cycle regulator [Ponticaulis sp.]MAI90155.1 GcrA cell cycle regulator [Ponticaulis sp.]OUY00279.1 MAG: GcrA cell cycle regulator [Hyphomonadaceae bacterium TMED5]
MSWTEERVEQLKKLWTEGHSASQIANQLGGVTRNAVIGKVHRLGLSGRATPSRPVKRPPRLARPKPAPQRVERPTVEPEAPAAPAAPSTLPAVAKTSSEPLAPAKLDNGDFASVLNIRESMCKWPIGDPMDKDFAFCGRAASGGPYCAEHAKVAFQPKKSARTRREENVVPMRRAAS